MDSGCDCRNSSNQKNKTHKSIKALQIRKTIEKIDELDDVGLPISPPTEETDQTVEHCEGYIQTSPVQTSPDEKNKLSSRTANNHLTLIKGQKNNKHRLAY